MRGFHIDPRWLLYLALYLVGGTALGWYLLTHPISQTPILLGMLILLIYLSIPACCGLKK